MNILILGGTKPARLLAEKLSNDHKVIYAIAGVTTKPQIPKNVILISGGFGGADGLGDYMTKHNIDLCVDATHPFAKQITQNAVKASKFSNTHLLHLIRKPWVTNENNHWQQFNDMPSLIAQIPQNARPFLAIGRQNFAKFTALKQVILARMIEVPDIQKIPLPKNITILLERPPFSVAHELALLKQYKITHIICKNSGGKLDAKLIAAHKLGLPVFMLKPPLAPTINMYDNIEAMVTAINHL